MAKKYSCRVCDYSFVLASGGIGTADVKTHCGKIMRIEEIDITNSEGFKKLSTHDQMIVREYRDTLRAKSGPRQPLNELDELRQENERLRIQLAAVSGTVIGAIANGHKEILLSLAADLGIEIVARVVDAKGDDSESMFF